MGMMNVAATTIEAMPEITGSTSSSLSAFNTCQDDLASSIERWTLPMTNMIPVPITWNG